MSYNSGYETAWDDVSNDNIVPELFHAARASEMDYFHKLGLYEKVTRERQVNTGVKIIGVRWVDVNKGDALDTNYGSRRVGREFNVGRDDALYTMGGIEIDSDLCCNSTGDWKRRIMMINDVHRAYLYATIHREMSTSSSPRKTQTMARGC